MQRFYQVAFFSLTALVGMSLVILRFNGGLVVEVPKASVAERVKPSRNLLARSCELGFESSVAVNCYWFYPEGVGRQVRLSVMVFKAPNSLSNSVGSKAEPLVFISGGPGSGRQTDPDAALFWLDWYRASNSRRDLVVYDSRGNGPGIPSWDCDAYTRFSLGILESDISAEEESLQSRPILERCFAQYREYLVENLGMAESDVLGQFSSQQNAEDLVGMMAALEYVEWNALAVSYGTRVALLAQQSGANIKSLILDSPYPSGVDVLTQTAEEPQQGVFAMFWQRCDVMGACGVAGIDSAALFSLVLDRLALAPVVVPVSVAGRDLKLVLNGHRLKAFLFSVLYDESLYQRIVPALQKLSTGEVSGIAPLVQKVIRDAFSTGANAMVYYATECNDGNYVGMNTGGFEGDEALIGGEVCRNKLFRAAGLPNLERVSLPTLIAGGELDPVTPLKQTRHFSLLFDNAGLVVASGVGHSVLHSGVCGYRFIEPFLSDPDGFIRRHSEGDRELFDCN